MYISVDLTSGTATSATSAGNETAAQVSVDSATTLTSNLKENICRRSLNKQCTNNHSNGGKRSKYKSLS